MRKKAENMREFSEIPHIKMDSFYIKHYSNEIYEVSLKMFNFLIAIINAFEQALWGVEKLALDH